MTTMDTATVNLSLPKNLLSQIDQQARKESRTRSELMREALRAYIRELSAWEEIFEYGKKQAKKLGIKQKDIPRLIDEYRRGV